MTYCVRARFLEQGIKEHCDWQYNGEDVGVHNGSEHHQHEDQVLRVPLRHFLKTDSNLGETRSVVLVEMLVVRIRQCVQEINELVGCVGDRFRRFAADFCFLFL